MAQHHHLLVLGAQALIACHGQIGALGHPSGLDAQGHFPRDRFRDGGHRCRGHDRRRQRPEEIGERLDGKDVL